MPIGKLISDKAEYKYSEDDVRRLIAEDLKLDVQKVQVNFVRKENVLGDRHNYENSYIHTLEVTVDNTLVPQINKRDGDNLFNGL